MIDFTKSIDTFFSLIQSSINWLKGYRKQATVTVCILFISGLLWSIRSLNITWANLEVGPIALIFFTMGPLSIAYGTIGLILLARIADTRISFRSAWNITGYAQLAESLPLPGGAIVRATALKRSGVSWAVGVALVTATAVLWIAMAAMAAGASLLVTENSAGWPFLLSGLCAFLPITIWIANRSGFIILLQITLHRTIGLLLMSTRLFLAFSVIGQSVPLSTAFFFSFANIAGSASVVAPAGLGIGEAIAMLLSNFVNVAPAAAFMAIAINRIISITSCATLVVLSRYIQSNQPSLLSRRN